MGGHGQNNKQNNYPVGSNGHTAAVLALYIQGCLLRRVSHLHQPETSLIASLTWYTDICVNVQKSQMYEHLIDRC